MEGADWLNIPLYVFQMCPIGLFQVPASISFAGPPGVQFEKDLAYFTSHNYGFIHVVVNARTFFFLFCVFNKSCICLECTAW